MKTTMKPANRIGLIAFGIVGGVFLSAAVGIIGMIRMSAAGPGAPGLAPAGLSRSGPEDYQGLAERMRKAFPRLNTVASVDHKGAQWFQLDGTKYSGDSLDYIPLGDLPNAVLVTDMGPNWKWADHSRNLADDEKRVLWGSGRFLFRGRRVDLDRVRKALD